VGIKGKFMEGAVEALLKGGPKSNREMRAHLGLPSQTENQTLDRALQRLKRAGKLQLLDGRWALVSVKACPTCSGKGWV
jgi:hypothetical protein